MSGEHEKESVPGRRSSRKVLPIIGALIVFLTFVVKERVRDHFHDRVSAMETAENFFLVRNDSTRIVYRISYLNRFGKERQSSKRGWFRSVEELIGLLSRVRVTADVVDASYENLKAFVNTVPSQNMVIAIPYANIPEKMQELRNQKEELSTDIGILVYPQVNEGVAPDAEEVKEEIRKNKGRVGNLKEDIATAVSDYEDDAAGMLLEIDTKGKEIVDAAAKARKEAEWWYRFTDWCSVLLYTIGWLLTFSSTLSGSTLSSSPE